MTNLPKMCETGVAVWSYRDQRFIPFCPCPGENRVRIDVFDDLDNYAVFSVTYTGDNTFDFHGDPNKPLRDWAIHYT